MVLYADATVELDAPAEDTITCALKLGLTVTPRLPKPVEPCRVNAAITIE